MKELFEKIATEVFFDESTNGAGQKMYMFGDQKMQKFAETIVRECAAIALREDHDPADCILAHFGLLNTAKPQRPGPLDSSYPDGDGYWK